MRYTRLLSLGLLAALTLLSVTALADPPGREREREKAREVFDGGRSPYETGYYSGRDRYFDYADESRWSREVRYADEHPSFFPDGRRMVFASNRDGRDKEIYCRDLTGRTPLVRLTHNGANDYEPTVSPDGRWIAFLSDRDGRIGLFVMRSDGRDVRCLARGTARGLASPSWSPDGRWVAFTSRQSGGAALLRTRADGSGRIERLGGWDEERTICDL
jgi:hypothetical protein